MDYTPLIDDLIQSYSKQLGRYNELKILGQQILGQMALSRGDFSGVMGFFEKKQKLLKQIEEERKGANDNIARWQKEKNSIPPSENTARLDAVLADTEKAIKDFLDTEDELKKFLEHTLAGNGNGSTT
jgi:hypothetical protein